MSRILITVGVVIFMLAGEGSRAAASTQAQRFGPLEFLIIIRKGTGFSGIVFGFEKGVPTQYGTICVNSTYQVEVFVEAYPLGKGASKAPTETWKVKATGNRIEPEEAIGGVPGKWVALFIYKPTTAGEQKLTFNTADKVKHPITKEKESVKATALPITVTSNTDPKCLPKAQVIYQGYYQGEGFALASTGWMDEVELTPVDEQHYAGSGTYYMNTIYMIPGCSLSHTTYTVLTTINAYSSEETLALTFESEVGEVVLSGECGGYGLSAVQPAASLADFGLGQVTLPPEGGAVNVPSSPFPGTFTIIVTWEEEEEAIPVSDVGEPTGGLPAWLILADTSP